MSKRCPLRMWTASLLGCAFLIFLVNATADAFKTYNWVGGTIHQNISSSALPSLGVSEASFQVIDDGNTSQDILGSEKFTTSSHHCDDNELAAAVGYVGNRYAYIRQNAANAHKDKKAWRNVLYAFGELLHTAQDFYSHSNYVEMNLKRNVSLRPADIPLVNWGDLAYRPRTQQGVKTGYFLWDNVANNELTNSRDAVCKTLWNRHKGITFAYTAEYERRTKTFAGYVLYATDPLISVLHRDVNKDNDRTEAGHLVVPATGHTLFAYAFNLAVRETARQWQRLESVVRAAYPKDAEKIIRALKTGMLTEPQVSDEDFKLARIEVTRTYPPGWTTGIVEPGTKTYPAGAGEFTMGWDLTFKSGMQEFNYQGVSHAAATVTLTHVPAVLKGGGSTTFSASMTGEWKMRGYGIDRDHTIKLSGAAGEGQWSIGGTPSGDYNGSTNANNTVTVAESNGNQWVSTISADLNFGGDHWAKMEVRLIYLR